MRLFSIGKSGYVIWFVILFLFLLISISTLFLDIEMDEALHSVDSIESLNSEMAARSGLVWAEKIYEKIENRTQAEMERAFRESPVPTFDSKYSFRFELDFKDNDLLTICSRSYRTDNSKAEIQTELRADFHYEKVKLKKIFEDHFSDRSKFGTHYIFAESSQNLENIKLVETTARDAVQIVEIDAGAGKAIKITSNPYPASRFLLLQSSEDCIEGKYCKEKEKVVLPNNYIINVRFMLSEIADTSEFPVLGGIGFLLGSELIGTNSFDMTGLALQYDPSVDQVAPCDNLENGELTPHGMIMIRGSYEGLESYCDKVGQALCDIYTDERASKSGLYSRFCPENSGVNAKSRGWLWHDYRYWQNRWQNFFIFISPSKISLYSVYDETIKSNLKISSLLELDIDQNIRQLLQGSILGVRTWYGAAITLDYYKIYEDDLSIDIESKILEITKDEK